jgi:hypothetical protein
MEKQLYEKIEGGGYRLLISWEEYRDIMFKLRIPEDLVPNVFFHSIKGKYLIDDICVTLSVMNGECTTTLSKDDNLIDKFICNDFSSFWLLQNKLWVSYGIVISSFITDENILIDYCSVLFYPPILSGRTEWDVMEVRPDYYIHKMGDEWCLYNWVSGQDEICMDIYVDDGDINIVKDKFRTILDEMGVKAPDKTTNWSDVTYNEDGTFTLTKCG